MQRCHEQLSCIFFLFIALPLINASMPTIDNFVNILQSPTFHRMALPQQLIATSPVVVSTEADKKNTQADVPTLTGNEDASTLKLVTRVLDTFKPPLPSQSVILIPQKHRALPGCPLCDASVYSYCDYKVFHDGCCCNTLNGGYGNGFGGASNGIGYGGCGYQEDCSFLYANSCYEHQLIVNCCCNSPY